MNVVNQQRPFSQSVLRFIYVRQANETVYNDLVDDLFRCLRRCNHEHCLSALRRSLEELLSCGEVSFNPITRKFESDGEFMALHIYNILYWFCLTAPAGEIHNAAPAA